MVKKVLKKLDSPKASRFDCIPVVVLKKVSERALFSRLLEGLISGPCIFKNVEEMSTARNYLLVSLLSVVTKVLEKLVNSRIVDHLEKCGIFSGFHYGFRSSRSTADHLTVVPDRIASTFNRSRPTRAVALDISKAFNRV